MTFTLDTTGFLVLICVPAVFGYIVGVIAGIAEGRSRERFKRIDKRVN